MTIYIYIYAYNLFGRYRMVYDPLIKSQAVWSIKLSAIVVTYPAEFRRVETRILHQMECSLVIASITCPFYLCLN